MALRGSIGSLAERLRGDGVGAVLLRGAGAFLSLQVLGMAASFLVHLALARNMGAEGYGVYVYCFSWLTLLFPLCRLGLGTSSLRFVAEYQGGEQWGLLRGFFRFAHRATGIASLVLAVATAAAVAALASRLPEALVHTFWVGCLALPLYARLQFWGPALRALRRVVASQLATTALPPLLLAAGLGALLAGGAGRLGAPTVMGLQVAAAFGSLVFAGFTLRGAMPAAARSAEAVRRDRAWLRVTLPLMLMNLLNLLVERTDILFIGTLLGPERAGVYAPAARIATLIAVALIAVNAWAAPMIADLFARERRDELQRLVRRAAQIVFALTLPVTGVVVVWGREILALFGPEFTEAYASLVILVMGQLVNALTGPVVLLLTMTGQQDTAARILAVVTVGSLALNAVLVPAFGIEGAAVAASVTRAAWNLVVAFVVWRRMGLRATVV